MFYCEPCAIKNKWPTDLYLPMSQGPCEICGKHAQCFDVPSSRLPDPNLAPSSDSERVPESYTRYVINGR